MVRVCRQLSLSFFLKNMKADYPCGIYKDLFDTNPNTRLRENGNLTCK